ncbi:MAG: transcriptional regulator NrdR [Firmicutes bacterium]|nr:transcriptional regulator NrdR [Bacillota bacterium]MCL2771302.1 transcriptional regulator NrdR [Bacillota bacterium]
MKCIFCGHIDSKVIDSRTNEDGLSIRRRRECIGCGKRYTTYETVETTPILVIKSNGARQPFSAQKVKSGMIKACEKRPVTITQIDEMVKNIEKRIYNSLSQEVETKQIGEMVMEELRAVDEVAYIRFASVYRQFKDISHFKEFLETFIK